jgi:tryptophan 2,3-dioxygenase
MRFPNDTSFHLRMAALLIATLFLEHLARTKLPGFSSPQIGVVTFVLGLVWVALLAMHHARAHTDRLRVLEDKLDRALARLEAFEDTQRARRSLPPM